MTIANPALDPEVEGPALKPHKGSISDWIAYKCPVNEKTGEGGLGFFIAGRFVDHHQFHGLYGHTSWIEKYDQETGEIETRNSRYTLIGKGAFPVPIKYGTKVTLQ